MEESSLTDAHSRSRLFQEGILLNLGYWQTWLANKTADVAALDRERHSIVKAISFALDLEEFAWPAVCPVIEMFSPYIERRGYWESWHPVLTRAITVARQSGDRAGGANLLALLARLLYRQSRFRESTACYRQAIRASRQIGDRFGEARACTNLGYFYIEKGHSYRAEVLCCHALHIFEQLENDHGRAHTENHLGILYTWQGLWDAARRHLERACALWQARGDQHGLIYGFMNLGLLSVEMERPTEALAYSEKALHHAKFAGEELEIAKIYMNMGLAYKLRGELTEAERYTRQAETIFRRFFNVSGVADALENLGVIYLAQQKASEAIGCLENALQMWRSLNNKHDQIKTIIYLAYAELTGGNQEKADLWLKEAEQELSRYSQAGRYYHLSTQIDKLRRSLTEFTVRQAAAG